MGDNLKHIGKITADMVRKETAIRKTKNKFSAVRTETADGIKHDSKKEAARWAELNLREKAGEISNLRRQVVIFLEGRDGPLLTRTGRKMRLTLDFAYTDNRTGLTIYEDSKGVRTRDYDVRKSVAAAQGIEVIEV